MTLINYIVAISIAVIMYNLFINETTTGRPKDNRLFFVMPILLLHILLLVLYAYNL